jgi:hypothetical protein
VDALSGMNRTLAAEVDALRKAMLEKQVESGRLQETLQEVCHAMRPGSAFLGWRGAVLKARM